MANATVLEYSRIAFDGRYTVGTAVRSTDINCDPGFIRVGMLVTVRCQPSGTWQPSVECIGEIFCLKL